MELLFRREQTSGHFGRVNFKLWSKIELDQEERAIIKRYRLDEASLIEVFQPKLLRNAIIFAFIAFMVISGLAALELPMRTAVLIGLAGSVVIGFLYFHENRETIFVRDLLYGRHFSCPSVVELARKEAWLGYVVSFLRQVMESAKHWDGTERHTVEALPKDEARQVIIRGL